MTEEKHGIAHCRADIIWALEPFVRYQRRYDGIRLWDGEIVIEPCAEGGVTVVGIAGHAMAAFHDPDGRASGVMTLSLPDSAFKACTAPAPVSMSMEGEGYSVPLPEYMQPGKVWFSSAGMFVMPKMRAPCWADEDEQFQPVLFDAIECGKNHYLGRDYKWTDGARMDWRKAFRADVPREMSVSGVHFRPEVVALFDRCARLASMRNPEQPESVTHSFGQLDKPLPTLIQVEGLTGFVGAYMPTVTPDAIPSLPTFLKKTAETSTGEELA